MSKRTESANPAYPDAHPTAPGGMSEKALVKELVERHGWDKDSAKALKWPEKIDAVITGRRVLEMVRFNATYSGGPGKIADLIDKMDYDEREDAGFDVDHPDDQILFVENMSPTEVTRARHVHDAHGRCVKNRNGTACDEPGVFGDVPPTSPDYPATPTPLFLGMPDTKDFIFDGHAGAGPSGAERWMNCTASLAAAREFLETLSPNQQVEFAKGSDAARQGTTAHAAAESEARLILGEIDQSEHEATLLELTIMPDNDDEAYSEEMAEFITEYVDLVKTFVDSGHDVLIEHRVQAAVPLVDTAVLTDVLDPTDEVHVIEGSADFIAMPTDDEPELVVGDLKYGDGIYVEVDENSQARIYALGALAELADEEGNLPDGLEKVTYYIIQPRLGGIRSYTETVDDLLTWRDEVLSPALSLALVGPEGGATYTPSDVACQWCPARGGCAALAEQRVEHAAGLFDTIVEAEFADGPGSFPEASSLTDTRLGELLAQISGLVDLHKDLKAEAQRRLHRGSTVPGFKLVSYTPARKWKDYAAEELDPTAEWWEGEQRKQVEALWQHKLLSPTQAMELLKKEKHDTSIIEPLIDVPDKRPIVAPESSNRKTWDGKPPEQMFEVE